MTEKNERKTTGIEGISPELIEQAKAGDQAAFTELYERTSTMLYRTIHSMVRDEDLVWDIQQDSYLRAWKGLPELQASEAFLPWLRRIAVNAAATALTKRKALTFSELAEDEDEREPEFPDLNPDTQPELALDRKETSRLVRELLTELSPEQQAVVGMRYYEDMPISEIAKTLSVAPGTVKTLLFRGRKRIEAGVRALEKQGVKLYGLSPLPFLLTLLRRLEPAVRDEKKALAAVLEQAPAASGTAAVTVTAMTAGQAFLKGLGTKLLAGALALSLIAVGGKLSYDTLTERKAFPMGDEQPIASESTNQTENGEKLMAVTPEDLIGATEERIKTTEPPVTAEVTEPAESTKPTDSTEPTDPEEPAPYSGVCGDDLTWSFEPDTGVLTIEGSGAMNDYRFVDDPIAAPPWNSFIFNGLLKSVSLPKGLTYIGSTAFEYCSDLSSMTIPDSVTAIGYAAFAGCTGLSSVAIPESVTSIEDDTFAGCTGLTAVTIPEGVSSIGYDAFHGCTGLRSVTIPRGVAKIGSNAFGSCTGLTSISVHSANPYYSSDENGVLYNKDRTELLTCPAGKSGQFVVSSGVTTIGSCSFEGCSGLSSVVLPEGIAEISYDAFSGCTGLTDLSLPDSVTVIRSNAFCGCTGLSSVKLPANLNTIEYYAFRACEKLSSVTIPDGITAIEHGTFQDCASLSSATIPESVTRIESDAFDGCSKLTIRGVPGSEAERYANENGIPFEALAESLFQDVLAEAHTAHTNIYNRTNNLKLACAAIDGAVLMPGETFSFNGVVGQPTEEKGYLPAADSVSGGESASEVGGGISQVASSLYYAALQADLTTVERSPHMYLVDYVPPGMDSTIYWGSLDYKFENNSPYPIKIEASVSGGKVHIVLLGTEWKDYTVELSYEILETTEWETVEKEVPNDGTYQNGEVLTTPLTGYKIAAYRTARSVETGSKLETTEIAVSRYKKRDKVIAKVVGTVTEPTQPTPPTSSSAP